MHACCMHACVEFSPGGDCATIANGRNMGVHRSNATVLKRLKSMACYRQGRKPKTRMNRLVVVKIAAIPRLFRLEDGNHEEKYNDEEE